MWYEVSQGQWTKNDRESLSKLEVKKTFVD